VNAYTADTTSTVTIDVSGIAVDTTNQTAVEIDLGGELNNDIVITAGSGTGDTVDMENGTYTGDITFTKVDTITSTGGLFTATAASFNGAELAINGGAVQHILNGTANGDTINLADVTMTAGTLDVRGAAGDDTITGTDAADTIDGDAGADTIKGGEGIDTITLGGTDTDADTVDVSDVIVTANRDAISEFETTVDHVKIKNTMGLDSGDDIGAFVTVALKANATIDDIIADTAANLGASAVSAGDLSATFTSGGFAFETDTGKLYYDADGDFTAGVELIATITGSTLVAGDFVVA
jgi:Ca2+-binding RTX toxin-like protein